MSISSAPLLILVTALAAHAQTVTFSACNPGAVAVDVYFAQGATISTQHVNPADCATLAKSPGRMTPGLVAVAFPNAQGQWGGVHRMEHVPAFGSLYVDGTISQSISVQRGATRTSIPAQFNFTPPTPICTTETYREQIPGGGSAFR